MLSAAREALEALRRDAASSAAVKEEVLRLEAAAFDMEGEDRRLEVGGGAGAGMYVRCFTKSGVGVRSKL